ncbi:MAG TPA: alpha/beta hydrolase [Burkholderiaceae bacterium]|nr:alpha/beta hydrolase [Burkholderiaceae bacterium]
MSAAASGVAAPPAGAVPPLEDEPLVRTVLDDGLAFHHAERGDGPPLVFLHGVLGDWRTWAPQWPAFVPRFRCISYSRRYSVPNGNVRPSPDHSAVVEAQDLEALLPRWRAAPAVLVGASYGGYAALALACRRPDLVRALVLVEPPVMRLADATEAGRLARAAFDRDIRLPAREAFERGDDVRATWLLTEGILGGADLGAQSGAAMSRRLENVASLRHLTLSTDEFPPLDPARLASPGVPVLLLSGERTPNVHDAVFRALCAAMPHAEHAKVPDAGHGVARDAPAAFNALALGFLARHGLPA